MAVLSVLGLTAGLGAYTFIYAKGLSYLSNDPEACKNCHVMNGVYEGWLKSDHQHVAVCNDCHVPHDFVGKWYTKASNGFHHSWAFTFEEIPLQIRARESSQRIAQANCVRCHEPLAHAAVSGPGRKLEELSCKTCHREVGHPH